MSTEQEQGRLYRCAKADGDTIRRLVGELVGLPCWSFGGAVLWDVEPDKKRDNLRPISAISDLAKLDLSGDFGHAFSAQAELRWKRRDAQCYDLLLLTERSLSPEQAGQFGGGEPLLELPTVRTPKDAAANMLDTPREEREQGVRYRLDRKEYRDAQGRVHVVRYTGLRKEQERSS